MSIQAIIFDLDGTLAETAELHRNAWNAAFAECGIGWHWDRATFSTLLHLPDGPARLYAYGARSRGQHLATLLGHDDGFRRLTAAKTFAFSAALRAGGAVPRPGVIRLINEARAEGLPVAVASTGSLIEFELLVFHAFGFDALGWFDCVRTRQDCHTTLAAKCPYRAVIDAMGLSPHLCLAIDDSDEGTCAAAGCGLRVLATPGLYTSSHRFDRAALVLSDLGCPDTPFNVIRGNACGHGFTTPTALRDWAGANRIAA